MLTGLAPMLCSVFFLKHSNITQGLQPPPCCWALRHQSITKYLIYLQGNPKEAFSQLKLPLPKWLKFFKLTDLNPKSLFLRPKHLFLFFHFTQLYDSFTSWVSMLPFLSVHSLFVVGCYILSPSTFFKYLMFTLFILIFLVLVVVMNSMLGKVCVFSFPFL